MSKKGEVTRATIAAAAEALILRRGYAGASLDEIIAAAATTKGAFFHHFKGKADLAHAVLERYAARDFALFEEWSARADRQSEDPLERVLAFLKHFEDFLDGQGAPPQGCVFASYAYESAQFGPELRAFMSERLRRWIGIFEGKFEALLARRKPALPATARALAEAVATLIEGGYVMAKALDERRWLQRQLTGYRRYLELLFRT